MAHIYREIDGEEQEIEVECSVSGRYLPASGDGPEELPELEVNREDLTEAEYESVSNQVGEQMEDTRW